MKRNAPYLSDHALGRELTAAIAREDVSTAVVLDHIAEYDERRLYRDAGFPSMFAYCVEALHRSEEAAYKRIRAARAGQANELQLSPGTVQAPTIPTPEPTRPIVKPLAPQRYAVQFTMSQEGRDKLRYAQELLGHGVASEDIAQVFERALDALIPQLEKRKFAATSRPRPRSSEAPSNDNARQIPARVRREVWKRDKGQCTFVSESGHRCAERKGLQFDHDLEVARGGEASASNVRLLCHAHNRLEAERTFGPEFMRHKRIAASEARAEARAAARAPATAG